MRLSTWLFIGAGAWLGVEVIASMSQSGTSSSSLQTIYAQLAAIDARIPLLPNNPPYMPATALALAGAGAVLRFGFGK